MKAIHTTPGSPEPLGATCDGPGANFALHSEGATAVNLCLFDEGGKETQIPLRHRTEFVWHAYVKGVAPGTRYGFRVDGPWDPERGLRFNPRNVLLDPYARSLAGPEDWGLPVWRYDVGDGRVLERRLAMPHRQNTVHVTYALEGGEGTLRLRWSRGCIFARTKGRWVSL